MVIPKTHENPAVGGPSTQKNWYNGFWEQAENPPQQDPAVDFWYNILHPIEFLEKLIVVNRA